MNKALNYTTTDPNDWATPASFFEKINADFGPFTLDACALPHNAKCEKFFSPQDDGLVQDWSGVVWCNPPYGHGNIVLWLRKGISEISKGNCHRAIFLIPAATDTAWFHECCMGWATKIIFLRNRLYFTSPERTGRSSHPSMLVIFTRLKIAVKPDADQGPYPLFRTMDAIR